MTIDYWRNEDEDVYLQVLEDGSFRFYSEWDNDVCRNRLSIQDLKNLRNCVDFLLRTE